ncbi:hypothetical protein [Streptomyces sp. NPDC058989]|uniref:hypothetical protein n=1 Tax=Streptomyces sp. NPDC058989 TaxID=3346686 RepID=UPI0036D08B86
MYRRLFRAGAVVGAALSALIVGGAAQAAVAAPHVPASHRMAAAQHPGLVPEECGVVPVTTPVTLDGKKAFTTMWYFNCTLKEPQPAQEPPP